MDTIQNKKKSRIIFIDLMRAFAVLMMVQGHTIDAFLGDSYRSFDSPVFNFWNFWRGLTAPIFMFSAGTVFTYLLRLHNEPFLQNPRAWKGVKRFLLLISLAYLLRWPTPYLVYFGEVTPDQWKNFFVVDVLHLIAFGILFTVILAFAAERFKIRDNVVFGTSAFLFFSLYPWFSKIQWNSFLPEPLTGYFFTGTGSLFPLFPWAGYILCGAILGSYLAKNPGVFKTPKFSGNLLIIGLAFVALSGIGDRVEFWLNNESTFWTTSPNLIIFRIGIVLLLNSLVSYLAIRLENIPPLIIHIGRSTLPVYVIHLVILFGTPWTVGFYPYFGKSLDVWTSISAAVVMVTLMIAIVQSVQLVKSFYRKKLAPQKVSTK